MAGPKVSVIKRFHCMRDLISTFGALLASKTKVFGIRNFFATTLNTYYVPCDPWECDSDIHKYKCWVRILNPPLPLTHTL